ncbi:S-protein homolog 2-like [Raphanus sativus]|uniref:S-protein homolog n=1 Tax=Raphanus sativus TaxID=3726 RepID=A0A6J0LYM1_RAPSA|nr:S-protein homolog 2-like [Raphanus sativus]
MDSLKHHKVLFIMVIMFMSATMSRAKKTTVVIHNDLGSGLSLGYHCKSGDNDLGYGRLGVGGSWFFRFKPDIFGRTLFFCRFSLGNESHYFDIYKQKRDREFEKFGCTYCEWKIRKNGPCKLNKITNKFDVCLPWKS